MKDLIFSIANIFVYAGKVFTFIRNIFLNLLLLAVVIGVIVALLPNKGTQINQDSILRLDITGDIVEEKRILSSLEKFIGESFNPDTPEPETALQDILDIINEATVDDRISVILLNLKHIGKAGLNQLKTIGEALERFRDSGKTVVAAEDFYTQSQYFLASHADEVIVNPMGGVDIHGFGVYRLYFKDALERLEINYNIFRVGTYKSALEPFTRNSMSIEDQRQNDLWLSALWNDYTKDIVRLRSISDKKLHFYTDNIANALKTTNGDPAQLALQSGLVDEVWTREEVNRYLASLTNSQSSKLNILSSATYFEELDPSYKKNNSDTPTVGLIIAEGNILPGKQPPGVIGGDSLALLIKKARKNDQVKALVLRINSGGGSAFASEIIRQELLLLKKSNKPLVISMGAVAASGGYWIAADGDEIWASPSTITGSIGIFGAIPTFEKTLANVGVYSDGTGTTPLASGLDLTQPLPEQLKNAIQQTVNHNYDQFLQIVAEGRNIEKSKVEMLAQGRVYDGKTAQQLGLVDKIGPLDKAIEAAASLAGIIDPVTEYIRTPTSVSEQFFRFFTSESSLLTKLFRGNNRTEEWLKRFMDSNLDNLLLFNDPRNVYAHCLINLTF
ncbi:MAG: signal peptide peptidase SppA [Desulforhopalus sp.]